MFYIGDNITFLGTTRKRIVLSPLYCIFRSIKPDIEYSYISTCEYYNNSKSKYFKEED